MLNYIVFSSRSCGEFLKCDIMTKGHCSLKTTLWLFFLFTTRWSSWLLVGLCDWINSQLSMRTNGGPPSTFFTRHPLHQSASNTLHILINRVDEGIPLEGGFWRCGTVDWGEPENEEGEKKMSAQSSLGWGLSGGSVVLIIDPKQPPKWEQRALKYSLKPCSVLVVWKKNREGRKDSVRSNVRRLAF